MHLDLNFIMKKQFIVLTGACVLLAACAKDVYNPDICFQETILPIFVNNCAQSDCHNPSDHKAGYDLTTYDGIMKGVKPKFPMLSKCYTTVRGNNPSMPRRPYSNLSARQITDIKVWIEMGAPNTSNCKSCDTSNFTFSGRVNPIIQAWCVGCHSPANAGGGYDLTTYAGIVTSITNNRLMGSLEHLSGFSAMPKNTGAINSCDVAAIRKWVEARYPEN